MQKRKWPAIALSLLGLLASSCASVTKSPPPWPPAPVEPLPATPAAIATAPESAPEPAPVPQPPARQQTLRAADWSALPDWGNDKLTEALPPLLLSCGNLKSQPDWQSACAAAARIPIDDPKAIRQFFESTFAPYAVHNADGSTDGLVTGYYEPLLRGSRTPTKTYRFPVYGVPDDLLVVDLTETQPNLKGVRLRGRLQGNKVVPYYTRAEIERGEASVRGREILWVDDAVELFFLQVQGSGRVNLQNGEIVRLGFAEHNGHPYRSIGRVLVERGELAQDKASMQGIKQWGRQNPDLLPLLLQQNPAYVFFREMPLSSSGPVGALGIGLTPGRSIAVDPSVVPLGAPVFLSSSWPLSQRPLNRLVFAQDTGSAIKGAVRADFFWGFGDEAGQIAGRMRQSGRMWVLYPLGFEPRLP
ncbi:MAG TPA: MltA domain-containing protein [Burkholderiales bacterium]|jgi:membrane-bound lytic murein transglycosylase A|nr:MltA domain-containing protein [Burkholderiales bacterium]